MPCAYDVGCDLKESDVYVFSEHLRGRVLGGVHGMQGSRELGGERELLLVFGVVGVVIDCERRLDVLLSGCVGDESESCAAVGA